jgi:phosphatidylglycerol:prolipoprotein diacylglycerol transferase
VQGSLFFSYLVLAGIERFLIEFLRLNQKYLFGLSGAQLIALSMIGIGVWFLTHPLPQPQEIQSE